MHTFDGEPSTRWSEDPTTLFVLGLTGLLTCQALAPVVWWAASKARTNALEEGRLPHAFVTGARILGMVGTGLLVAASVWSLLVGVALAVMSAVFGL